MYLGIYKVRYRGIEVKMYTLLELLSQCLCTLAQQTHLEVDCRYVPTFKTIIHKENSGPRVITGIWKKHSTHLKTRTQDFSPQKARENPVMNMTQGYNL